MSVLSVLYSVFYVYAGLSPHQTVFHAWCHNALATMGHQQLLALLMCSQWPRLQYEKRGRVSLQCRPQLLCVVNVHGEASEAGPHATHRDKDKWHQLLADGLDLLAQVYNRGQLLLRLLPQACELNLLHGRAKPIPGTRNTHLWIHETTDTKPVHPCPIVAEKKIDPVACRQYDDATSFAHKH